MAAPKPHRPSPTPAVEFRGAIEAARRDGAALDQLILTLTLRASSKLRRDRTLAVEDIRYSDGGGMHFLGVEVITGEVNRLERRAEAA